jgi:GH24 family phage-related lysozyme (muramidase)
MEDDRSQENKMQYSCCHFKSKPSFSTWYSAANTGDFEAAGSQTDLGSVTAGGNCQKQYQELVQKSLFK